MELAIDKIARRVNSLRQRYSGSDARMAEVILARRGEFQHLAPDLFSDSFDRLTVANMIDTTARDFAAVLAPLPTISCDGVSSQSDRAKSFADKRTKIAKNYIESSKLQWQMNKKGADQLHTLGMTVFCIYPDFKESRPLIRIRDAIGAYPVLNSMGDVTEIAIVYTRPWVDIAGEFDIPWDAPMQYNRNPNDLVEVVEYSSSKTMVTFLPRMGNMVLTSTPNEFGKCNYVVAARPNLLDGELKGAYDDLLWVQLVRHRLQMLILEGVEDAVQAPLVVPNDVLEIPIGGRELIRTSQGANSVGRVRIDVPPQAFTVSETLREEMREGSMSPGVRAGDSDASVITGKGVNALQGMYQSQVSTLQTQLADAFQRTVAMCFEMDEKLFGNVKKEIRGRDAGVPYKETYVPSKDIAGDYTVEVSYGFAAGIGDPNRALVWILQAQSAGLVSKDYAQRNLPGDMNPTEETSKIYVEHSRDAIIAGLSASAQSIPALAANGQDATAPILQQAKFIQALQKGKSVEDAALMALAPEPAPPPAAPDPLAALGGDPNAAGPGGPGGASGFGPQGLPEGIDPSAVMKGQGGRPDLLQTFASLSGAGNPNMSVGVARKSPIQ